jgi:hypothetical protein
MFRKSVKAAVSPMMAAAESIPQSGMASRGKPCLIRDAPYMRLERT